jgi:hypothetical protein
MPIAQIEVVGASFSPLPRHDMHGYMVTIARHVEVEAGAYGRASAPPSEAAACECLGGGVGMA